MHASGGRLGGCLIALAVSWGIVTVSATPRVRRAESGLNPWVSVDANGKGSTVTPVLTTINGAATTLNAAPAALTATTTASDASPTTDATTTGAPGATQTPGGYFEVCNNVGGDFAPFCTPADGSSVYVGDSYFVTWDSTYFRGNDTLYIIANYVNASGGGPQAFQSPLTSSSWGFVSWTIQSDWLKGLSSNNVTLIIATDSEARINGPTVMVTNTPPPAEPPEIPTQPPKGKDLYIALPAVGGFVILCLCGGCIFNRKQRHIGLGSIMGRRRGYGVGKSRRQRLGLSRKGGAIQLREQELTAEGEYRDAPRGPPARRPEHGRGDSGGLASLVGSPTEERRPEQTRF